MAIYLSLSSIKYSSNICFWCQILYCLHIVMLRLQCVNKYSKYLFKNILSLLAGKFGKICTEFPLTLFLAKKNLQDFILKLFSPQNIHYRIKQRFSNLPNIASWSKVTTIEILLEMLYMACSCKRQHEKLSLEFGQTFDLKFFCLFSRGQTVFNFYKFYDGKLSLIFKNFNGKIWMVFHAAFQNTLTINFLWFVAVSQENY